MNKNLIQIYKKRLEKIFKKLETEDFGISKENLEEKVMKLFLNKDERKLINIFLQNREKAYKFEKFLMEKLNKNKFILYGAGGGGKLFFNFFCKKYNLFPECILDKNKCSDSETFEKVPIYLFNEIQEKVNKNFVIILTVSRKEYQKEILGSLKEKKFKNIIILPDKFWGYLVYKNIMEFGICWKNYIQFPDFYIKNKEKILRVLEILSDEKSLEIYYKCVKSFLFLKEEKVPFDSEERQYFPKDIKFNKGYSVFIDCGAYIGDTVQQLNKYYGKIKTLICFEPNIESYNKLQAYLQKNPDNIADKILILPCAVYNKEMVFSFKKAEGRSSITKNGKDVIFSVVLDKVLLKLEPTFIKMDIEGSELEALKGAEKIIKRYKPDLAICVYHHPAHFWEIPLYLYMLENRYKFYLRKYAPQSFVETILYAT